MTLVNSAQDKKFAGADVTPVNKKFVAKSFSTVDERTFKSFSSEKDFSAKRLKSETFARAEQTPNTQAKTKMASANAEFVTRKSSQAQTASDEGKVAATRDYTSGRPNESFWRSSASLMICAVPLLRRLNESAGSIPQGASASRGFNLARNRGTTQLLALVQELADLADR